MCVRINSVHVVVVLRSGAGRSEEHTSELQSRLHLVCRPLLEKKTATCSVALAASHFASAPCKAASSTRASASGGRSRPEKQVGLNACHSVGPSGQRARFRRC